MRRNSASPQLAAQTTLEANRELGFHARAKIAVAGQRHQQRLDTSVEPASVDVKYAHQCACNATLL
jgi:hypothetical protein